MTRTKSDFVSGAGTAFQIVKALSDEVRDLGGGDDDLRRMLSDEAVLRRMAELLVNTGLSFEELVKQAQLSLSVCEFLPEYNDRWVNKGRLLGRKFVTLRMNSSLGMEENRRPATVDELVFYAAHGWDGKTRVAAFGSIYRYKYDSVAYLWGDGLRRGLDLIYADRPWDMNDLVLVAIG